MFRVDGHPASLIDVYEAVADDPARVRLDRAGATSEPIPRFDAAYIGMFRHMFVSTQNGLFDDNDGWHSSRMFAHYARQGIGPYPEGAKRRAMALAMAAACGTGWCLILAAAIGLSAVPRLLIMRVIRASPNGQEGIV